MQLKLVDAGYEIEAQNLEVFKSESVANSSEYTIKKENSDDRVHPKIAEYMNLLEKGNLYRSYIIYTDTLYTIHYKY